MSEIRDINLYESGERKIQWVKQNMPLLRSIEKEFSDVSKDDFIALYINMRISKVIEDWRKE